MVESTKLKIAILGATGAIGKEVVRHARNDPRVGELTLIVRRRLEEWDDFGDRLKVITMDSFDDLSGLAVPLAGYDVFLSTLGSRQKEGEVLFRLVE